MFIEGDSNKYTNNVTRQKISLEELCQGNKSLESIFNSLDKDKSGSLEGKELEKLMKCLQDMGEYFGKEDTIDEKDLKLAMYDLKPFKGFKTDEIKSFASNFLKLNDGKVKEDFEEDVKNFNKENNYESIENNNRIIPNKEGQKGFKLVYDNNGKLTTQNIGEKAGRFSGNGYYEIYYDIKDSKGNVIIKNGLYDSKNNFISSRADYSSSNTDFIKEFATFRGMQKTNSPYVYENGKGVPHHFENGALVAIDKLLISEEDGYLCQMERKAPGYVRDFTETVGCYKGKKVNSEAEYYILKNNLNLEIVKDDGTIKYVDKSNNKKVYAYSGKGQFKLTKESIIEESKKYKVNGKVDKPIYQKSVGNCYMVSAIQGISKYFPTLMENNNVISPNEDPFSITIPDPDKDKYDVDSFTVSLPGIDTNHTLGSKKHYTITKQELQEALDSHGEHASMGDPDEVLIELAFKKMRTGLIENLIKKYPQFKDNPFKLASIHNNNIGNAKEYYLSPDSIIAYMEGNTTSDDILTAGTEESTLRAMMPKGTKIENITIPSGKTASEVIEEYQKNNYMILGTYKINDKDGNHCVLFDNKSGKFISTYDPNSFDPNVLSKEDINNKMICLTVVKIPDKPGTK